MKGGKRYYVELRCIQIYKSSEKGQNANEKADTTCQKSMCVCTLGMFRSAQCVCCRLVHARFLHKISNAKEILSTQFLFSSKYFMLNLEDSKTSGKQRQ